MPPREMTDEEKFEVGRVAFGQILLANSRTWEGYRNTPDKYALMKKIIKDVRGACDEMEMLLQKQTKAPVKELSKEDYEAKVKAGKKITLAKGGKY